MKCITKPVELRGNWESDEAQALVISFEKCDPKVRSTCKSDLEIREWMKQSSIYIVYNKVRFEVTKFGSERFRKTAFIEEIPIDINDTLLTRYSLQISSLNSQEQYWPSPSDFETYSNLVYKSELWYYEYPAMFNGVLIDIDPDIYHTNRNIYTFTDWIEEVGGFVSMVSILFIVLHNLIKFEQLETYLINHLFKQAPKSETETPTDSASLLQKLLQMVQDSLMMRKSFERQYRNPIIDHLRKLCRKSNRSD